MKQYKDKRAMLVSSYNNFVTKEAKRLKWGDRFASLYFLLSERFIHRFLARFGSIDVMIAKVRRDDGAEQIYAFVDEIPDDEFKAIIEEFSQSSIDDESNPIGYQSLVNLSIDILCGGADLRVSFFGTRVTTKYSIQLYDEVASFLNNNYSLAMIDKVKISLLRYLTCNVIIRFVSYLYSRYAMYKKENFTTKYRSVMKRKRLHKFLMKFDSRYVSLYKALRQYVKGTHYNDVRELWYKMKNAATQNIAMRNAFDDINRRFNIDVIERFIERSKERATNKKELYMETDYDYNEYIEK